jgi:hypothetical protein
MATKARLDVLIASRLCPLPGTPIFDRLTEEDRGRLNWGGYTHLDLPGFDINLTALPDDEFAEWYRRFRKYFVVPCMHRQMLRDLPADDRPERRRLRRRLLHFALHHPIRAARLPTR